MGPRDCRVDIDGRDYCSEQLHRPNGKTPVLLPGMQPILWPPASLRACEGTQATRQPPRAFTLLLLLPSCSVGLAVAYS